jgi:hypothetical protein
VLIEASEEGLKQLTEQPVGLFALELPAAGAQHLDVRALCGVHGRAQQRALARAGAALDHDRLAASPARAA